MYGTDSTMLAVTAHAVPRSRARSMTGKRQASAAARGRATADVQQPGKKAKAEASHPVKVKKAAQAPARTSTVTTMPAEQQSLSAKVNASNLLVCTVYYTPIAHKPTFHLCTAQLACRCKVWHPQFSNKLLLDWLA